MTVEEFLIAELGAHGIPAFAYRPDADGAPGRFAVVQRVGGGSEPYYDEPIVAVDSYAGSRADAASLAQEVDRAVMAAADACDLISHVGRDSLYHEPDDYPGDRYQATYQLISFLDCEE